MPPCCSICGAFKQYMFDGGGSHWVTTCKCDVALTLHEPIDIVGHSPETLAEMLVKHFLLKDKQFKAAVDSLISQVDGMARDLVDLEYEKNHLIQAMHHAFEHEDAQYEFGQTVSGDLLRYIVKRISQEV